MASPGTLIGQHVLVVEDDRDARHILASVLRHSGALVTAVESVERARKGLRRMTPDIVVADMFLKDSNGFALLQQERAWGSEVPFVALSAHDFDAEDLKRRGFAAYLRKPVDHVTLVDTIRMVLRTH